MVYAVLHNNVNQRSENVLHIFSHFHFMFNCLKQWIQKTVLGMVIADKKKINTPGKKPHDAVDAEFVLWNTLTDGPGNYFSAFLFFYGFAMFYWEPPPSITKHAQWRWLFSLVSYYFNSFSFATHVWILQCRDISNTGKLNCILTLVFFLHHSVISLHKLLCSYSRDMPTWKYIAPN